MTNVDPILLSDQPIPHNGAYGERELLIDTLSEIIHDPGPGHPPMLALWSSGQRGKFHILRHLAHRLESSHRDSAVKPLRLMRRGAEAAKPVLTKLNRLWAWRRANFFSHRAPFEYDIVPHSPATPIVPIWCDIRSYRTLEETQAGLARSILDAISARLPGEQAERMWFDLNLRRTDPSAFRRRILASLLPKSLVGAAIAVTAGCAAAVILLRRLVSPGSALSVADLAAIAGVAATLIGFVVQAKGRNRESADQWAIPAESLSRPVADGLLGDGGNTSPDPYLLAWRQDVVDLLFLALHHCRIVLLVDDLERCTPDVAAAVLESLRELPGISVIAAFDPAIVAGQLEARFTWLQERINRDPMVYHQLNRIGWVELMDAFDLSVPLPSIRDSALHAYAEALLNPPTVKPPQEPDAPPPGRKLNLNELQANSSVWAALLAAVHDLPGKGHQRVLCLLSLWRFYAVMEHRSGRLAQAQPPIEVRARAIAGLARIITCWPWLLDLLAARFSTPASRVFFAELVEACEDDGRWAQAMGLATEPVLEGSLAGLRNALRRIDHVEREYLLELVERYT